MIRFDSDAIFCIYRNIQIIWKNKAIIFTRHVQWSLLNWVVLRQEICFLQKNKCFFNPFSNWQHKFTENEAKLSLVTLSEVTHGQIKFRQCSECKNMYISYIYKTKRKTFEHKLISVILGCQFWFRHSIFISTINWYRCFWNT